jgi:preprotein translocase subunit SecE
MVAKTKPKRIAKVKTLSKIVRKVKTTPARKVPKVLKPIVALGRYFKGAWFELKQVRWPNRQATWSLTGAVMLFTAFFVVLILLLDVFFKYIFELILR